MNKFGFVGYSNHICCLQQLDNEPNDRYYERYWIFVNNKNKFKNNNLDELEVLTKIAMNMKYLNCSYTDEIKEKINKLIDY